MENCTVFKPSTIRQAIGIDIANQGFEASLGTEQIGASPLLSKSQSFENTDQGFSQLIQWTQDKQVDLSGCIFVMEATGVYYEALAKWLCEHNYQVAVLLANSVMAFAKSLNVKTKNDQVDARTLAYMGCERILDTWKPPSKQLKELKQLTRHRERLVHQRSMFKNQYHASKKEAPNSSLVMESQLKLIRFLSEQIKKLEKQIRSLIKAHEKLEKDYQFITSIPAIGPTTAALLLAETQGFCAFRNRGQLVSYAGYDVIKRQSGSSINHLERISKKGNHRIRKALFFPALVAARHIPAFQRLYQRVNEKNAHTKMKGAVAIQRKLLLLVYTLIKNQQNYDPHKMI